MDYLSDKEFLKWLLKNEIIYDEEDNDLLQALYGEFKIEYKFKEERK